MSIPRLSADPVPPEGFEKLPAPGVQYRMNVATASSAPWVNANGWRIERRKAPGYYYDVPGNASALSAAEAFAYDADAVIHTDDSKPFEQIVEFLKQIDAPSLPVRANIGVIDDDSAAVGEVLNLLARRNLLFKIVPAPDPNLDINIRPDAKAAENPSLFAQKVRQQLTDAKRLLRVYGSDVVIGRLTGDGARARLHLLNYDSRRSIYGLRIRVRGSYAKINALQSKFQDYRRDRDATEFTLPQIDIYSVIDLSK